MDKLAHLIRSSQAGDRLAFQRLVDAQAPALYVIARRVTGTPEAAEDVVQDTFVKILQAHAPLRDPKSAKLWLTRIVTRTAINYIRAQETRRRHEKGYATMDQGNNQTDPSAKAVQNELLEGVAGAFAELPHETRASVWLHEVEGLSLRDVAACIGGSHTLAADRIKRGLESMRRSLGTTGCIVPAGVAVGTLLERLPSPDIPKGFVSRISAKGSLALETSPARGDVDGAAGVLATPHPAKSSSVLNTPAVGFSLAAVATLSVVVFALVRTADNDNVEPVRLNGTALMNVELTDPGSEIQADASQAPGAAQMVENDIEGTILLDATAAPVAGASVAAIGIGEHQHTLVVTTDLNGRYVMSGLAHGEYRLWAWKAELRTKLETGWDELITVGPANPTGQFDRRLKPGVIVSGTVIDDGTKLPIAGALVRWKGFQFARCNTEGHFTLPGIPAGRVDIVGSADGYADQLLKLQAHVGHFPSATIELPLGGTVEGIVRTLDGEPATNATVTLVSATATVRAKTSDDGSYQLAAVPLNAKNLSLSASQDGQFAMESISGFPMNARRTQLDLQLDLQLRSTLSGIVVDLLGNPIGGATVDSPPFGDRENSFSTDSEGRFRISGVSPQASGVIVRAPGYAPTYVQLDTTEAEWRDVEVVLAPGHFIAGTVVDARGRPIEDAWVTIDTLFQLGGETRTDANGQFRIENLPPASERIRSSKGRLVGSTSEFVIDREDVVVVVQEPGILCGTVLDAESGSPIEGFTVKITLAPDASRKAEYSLGLESALGDVGLSFHAETGEFIVDDVQTSVFYRVAIAAKGYVEKVIPEVEARASCSEDAHLRVELEQGEELHLRVVDAVSRNAVPGVRVTFVERRGGRPRSQERRKGAGRTGVTDAAGEVSLPGVTGKPGSVYLEKPGYARTTYSDVVSSVDLQTFRIAVGGSIEGRVETARGEPVSGVRLFVGGFSDARTNAEGHFRIDDLPGEKVKIRVFLSGKLNLAREVLVVAGESTTVNFQLGSASISGQVTLGNVPRAREDVYVSGAHGHAHVMTDEDGNYRVDGLPPGEYRVRVRSQSSTGEGETIEVTTGDTIVDIALGTNGVRGHVVDRRSGTPVSGVLVGLKKKSLELLKIANLPFRMPELQWQEIHGQERFETGPDGTFRFDELSPGTYLATVKRTDRGQPIGWTSPFAISETQDVALTIQVGGGALATHVTDGDGQAVGKAHVLLELEADFPMRIGALSGSDGQAILSDIPPGRYRLQVDAAEYLPQTHAIVVDDEAIERSVTLAPASWIVVELEGEVSDSLYRVVATCLSTSGPGWKFESASDGRPMHLGRTQPGTSRARIKTRPGDHRIRLEISLARDVSNPTPIIDETVEVTVPQSGTATVKLALPNQ